MGQTKEQNVWDPRDGDIDAKRVTETNAKTDDQEEPKSAGQGRMKMETTSDKER